MTYSPNSRGCSSNSASNVTRPLLEHDPHFLLIGRPAEIFKGKITATFTVKTGDSNCSIFHSSVSSKAGERYLLFLEKSTDYFVTGLCNGSGRVEWRQIQVELPELRRLYGSRPKQAHHRTSAATACAGELSAKETGAP